MFGSDTEQSLPATKLLGTCMLAHQPSHLPRLRACTGPASHGRAGRRCRKEHRSAGERKAARSAGDLGASPRTMPGYRSAWPPSLGLGLGRGRICILRDHLFLCLRNGNYVRTHVAAAFAGKHFRVPLYGQAGHRAGPVWHGKGCGIKLW